MVSHKKDRGVRMSSGINASNIFQSIWNLALGFFSGILKGIEGLFGSIFKGLGTGINIMFVQWGVSLGTYGIFGPMLLVVSLGGALFVGYLMLDSIGIEKDVSEDESAI